MALAPFANYQGPTLFPIDIQVANQNTANRTMDATGESVTGIGRLVLSTGPGTSKTLSSAGGGSIAWRSGTTITFANAGTNLRIGLQDVGATGIEDGTFDVEANLVGGTDTIGADTLLVTPMESGTKTVADGDLLAISVEMTVRAGADSVQLRSTNDVYGQPYITADTGSGPAKVQEAPIFTILFDDGTVGWLGGGSIAQRSESSTAFNTGSTPDEYALIFRLPNAAWMRGVLMRLASLAVTDDFEVILYSDPLGTPAAVTNGTLTIDADLLVGAAGTQWYARDWAALLPLTANTDYALAFRPTTANSVQFITVNFVDANLRKATPLGTNWYQGSRSNQTGAFSPDTTRIPLFGMYLLFDDGAGAGGGGNQVTGGRAGVIQ